MEKPAAVILAAGKGKRMKSKIPKVLHCLCGQPIINYVISQVSPLTEKQIIVIGHESEQVKTAIGDNVEYVYQKEQKGTGHAVLRALPYLPSDGIVLVLCGDTPLLKRNIIEKMVRMISGKAAVLLSAIVPDPTGYGRIVRNEGGKVSKIVEEQDAVDKEKDIKEINAGTYCFQTKYLKQYLPNLSNDNAHHEYYLTDFFEILGKEKKIIEAYCVNDYRPILGINDREQLAAAARFLRQEINRSLMYRGVSIIDPDSTYIDINVKIGRDSIIYPNTLIEGTSVIGEDCLIGPGAHLKDVFIGNGVIVRQSVVFESEIETGAEIGPFANIRPASAIGKGVKIGDFVEIKKSTIGIGSKIPHHSYIGDAIIGKNVNMGAGTIIVNYDGRTKNQTHIEDNAFVGCNSNLVAPLRVGEGAYIAAGSTITKDVPPFALALGRAKQTNKDNLAKRFIKRKRD